MYGVWADDGDFVEGSSPEEVSDEPENALIETEEPEGYTKRIPGADDLSPDFESEEDRRMELGEDVPDTEREEADEGQQRPPPGERQPAYGVFTPEIYPYTRYNAFNRFQGNKWLRASRPEFSVEVPELSDAMLEKKERQLSNKYNFLDGRYKIQLGPEWKSLPSAGADMKFLKVQVFDENRNPLDIRVEVGRDDADNYFIRAPDESSARTCVIEYRVAVDKQYFDRDLTPGMKFQYDVQNMPADVRTAITEYISAAGELPGKEDGFSGTYDFRQVYEALVRYFWNFKLEAGALEENARDSVYLDSVRLQVGVCRHRAKAFVRTALGIGMKARYVESEIHAFVEVWVPGERKWIRRDLGGGGDPNNMDLSPLANEQHVSSYNNSIAPPENAVKNDEMYKNLMEQAMKDQNIPQQTTNRPSQPSADSTGGSSGAPSGQADGSGGEASMAESDRDEQTSPDQPMPSPEDLRRSQKDAERKYRKQERERVKQEVQELKEALIQDTKLNDEVSSLFIEGAEDTEFIFERMLRAIQSRERVSKKMMKTGLEIDPIAFMLRKIKQFIKKIRHKKAQSTAACFLGDFSGSMGMDTKVKQAMAFAVAAIGRNFWKLKEVLDGDFHYDLTYYTERLPVTCVGMDDSLSYEDHDKRLKYMANKIGKDGNDLLLAMDYKLKNGDNTGMLDSRDARSAKVKYMVVFTDGRDGAIVRMGNRWVVTDEFSKVLDKYAAAKIDVIAIGIGHGAEQVEAFDGDGQHFIRIDRDRPIDIAESIAKIAEHKSRGLGSMPDGDITEFLKIGESGKGVFAKAAKRSSDAGLIGTYKPVTPITFEPGETDPGVGQIVFKAIDIRFPEKGEVAVRINAERAPPAIFEEYDWMDEEAIKENISGMLADINDDNVFLLDVNEFGIDGIGTPDILAIAKPLATNNLAKFHELAEAMQLNVERYLDRKELDTYVEEKVDKFIKRASYDSDTEYEEAKKQFRKDFRRHYAIRLFQMKRRPEDDAALHKMIKDISPEAQAAQERIAQEVQAESIDRKEVSKEELFGKDFDKMHEVVSEQIETVDPVIKNDQKAVHTIMIVGDKAYQEEDALTTDKEAR